MMEIFLQLTGTERAVPPEVVRGEWSGRHLGNRRVLVDGQDEHGWRMYDLSNWSTVPPAGQVFHRLSGSNFTAELGFIFEEDEFELAKLGCVFNQVPSLGHRVNFTVLGVDPAPPELGDLIARALKMVAVGTNIRSSAHAELVGLGKVLGLSIPFMVRTAIYDYLQKNGVDPRKFLPVEDSQEEGAAPSKNNAATADDDDDRPADDQSFSLAP